MILYTSGEIDERWRNGKGNEKVMVGLAKRKDLLALLCTVIFYYGILAYTGGVKFKSGFNIPDKNSHLTNGPSPTAGCPFTLTIINKENYFSLFFS